MRKYVKSPTYVNAVKWSGREDDDIITKFRSLGVKFHFGHALGDGDKFELEIEIPEGSMTVEIGDYIAELENGALFSCKPDVFEGSYSLVENQSGGTYIDGVRQ